MTLENIYKSGNCLANQVDYATLFIFWRKVKMEAKKKEKVEKWEAPKVTDLGKAKDLIKNVNSLGGGDTDYNLLAPS